MLNIDKFPTDEIDYGFSFEDGLLTTINTVQDGRFSDILDNTVSIAVSSVKAASAFGLQLPTLSGGAGTQGEDGGALMAALTDAEFEKLKQPTRDEISAALEMVYDGEHSFGFEIASTPGELELPGTNGLLKVIGHVEALPTTGVTEVNDLGDKKFQGIRVSLPVSTTVEVETQINLQKNYQERLYRLNKENATATRSIASIDAELASIDGVIAGLEAKEKSFVIDKNAVEGEIKGLDSQLSNASISGDQISAIAKKLALKSSQLTQINSDLSETRSSLNAARSKREAMPKKKCGLKTLIENNNKILATKTDSKVKKWLERSDYQRVFAFEESLIAVDPHYVAEVPITHSSFGRSSHELVLNKGVLLSYKTVKPAPAYVATNAIATTAERIVSLPSELIQLKIDTTNKSSELTQVQIDHLAKLQSQEEALIDAATQLKLATMDTEIKLLKKEMDLAEAKADAMADDADDSDGDADSP